MLAIYLLLGENDPWMFHQPNLRAYDRTHTLLGDLIDHTLAKYSRLYTLPIQSPTQDELGRRVADRMAYNQSGVTASYVPGQAIMLHANQAATTPVTGLQTAGAEQYGGQPITYVKINAGQTITIPLAVSTVPPTPVPPTPVPPVPAANPKVYIPIIVMR